MTALVRDSTGALKSVVDWRMRDASAALVNVSSVWMRDAAKALKLVWARFTAVPSVTETDGRVVSSLNRAVTTAPVTVTPNGGVGPFTYQWERTDSDPADWLIIGQGTATAKFRTNVAPGSIETASFRCNVGDASGVTQPTAQIVATCFNDGLP